jgi:DNA-binding Lrp family transcriptional regulator
LDKTDQKLLEILKQNGRASITTLANNLGVARATAKARLDQLKSSGVIRRFTVDIAPELEPEVIQAVMFLELDGAKERLVLRQLRKISTITSLHTTNGRWGLIGQLETHNLAEFDQTIRRVQSISGVINSETFLLLDEAPI